MLKQTEHRPWPLPRHPWVMSMHWHNLLFMHWPVPVAALRDHIPRSLPIDTFDGYAWIGVVPFYMSGVRPRFVPPLPGISALPELNVRTYVTAEGKPGVWFFSLDATSKIVVRAARFGFLLPYFDAHMTCTQQGELIRYTSARTHKGAPPATFRGQYQPVEAPYHAQPGTLDYFLAERYCLYTSDRRGRVWRSNIHHLPWPLQPAEAQVEVNTMTHPLGVRLPRIKPLLHFARHLHVVAWMLEPVEV